jgi:AcrR family transcriptional regulator
VTPRRTEAQAAETRSLLLQVGRQHFGTVGFAHARAIDVAELAGVTRGALLHHFVDKEGLFAAVLEEVETEVAAKVAAKAAKGKDPLQQLRFRFAAFLDACADPSISQIMLIDGPSVLGWEAWHEIDSRYGYAAVLGGVRAALEAGLLEFDDAESLAHLLLGAVAEAAIFVGRSGGHASAGAKLGRSLNSLIDGLRPDRGDGLEE